MQKPRSDGMNMWRTIGHRWAVEQLAAGLVSHNISRANLFTGPEAVGKAHLATEYAAALNCLSDTPPCGSCTHCRRISALSHPDVTFIKPDNGHIKIGQIRQMQYEISLKPYEARWRVAIITDMHTATEEAENALLKTLEEPPAQAVLILTALDAGLLEPTVVSRCRVMALQPVPADVIAQALVERGIEPLSAAEIARLSGGRVGWALQAAGNLELVERHQNVVADFLDLLEAGYADRIATAEALGRQEDLVEIIGTWQSVWRDVMLISAGCNDLVVNHRQRVRLEQYAQATGLEQALRAATDIQNAITQLEQNVNPRLVVESMLLGWRDAHAGPTSGLEE